MKNIWILEDDEDIISIYKDCLGEQYNLTFFNNIPKFISDLKKLGHLADLAIIDLNIFNNNFLNQITDAQLLKNFPFIIVSGFDNREFIKQAFQAGAIDYIIKPFTTDEIIAKIEIYLTRTIRKNPLIEKINECIKSEILTQKEIKILHLFIMQPEAKMKRDEIINNVWKGIKVHPKTLDVHLYNLRKKIKENGLNINCYDGLFELCASN